MYRKETVMASDKVTPSSPCALLSYQFEFAFENPVFSDCTIHYSDDEGSCHEYHPQIEKLRLADGSDDEAEAHCIEDLVPQNQWQHGKVSKGLSGRIEVCCAVIASQSAGFKRLLENAECHGSGRRHIKVTIPTEDEESLHLLLRLMHCGKLPTNSISPKTILQALHLAHRYGAEGCAVVFAAAMKDAILNNPEEDLLWDISQTPEDLLALPELLALRCDAKRILIQKYSGYGRKGAWDRFWTLDEDKFCTIIEEDDLDIRSENEMLDIAVSWVGAQYPEEEDQLEALAHIVWPGLRVSYLSPPKAFELAHLTLDLLSSCRPDMQCVQTSIVFLRDMIRSHQEVLQSSAQATNLHAKGTRETLSEVIGLHCAEKLVQAGICKLTEVLMHYSEQAKPRCGYSQPTGCTSVSMLSPPFSSSERREC